LSYHSTPKLLTTEATVTELTDVRVNFMHPTDGRMITVTVDGTMTANEAVAQLIANDFIAPSEMGYNLAVKGGSQLRADQSFADAGVKDGETLRVIPAIDAGWLGLPRRV
jgi:hypothetical protein